MAEEIDLQKCNFQNFRSSVTLILDCVKVTLMRISGRNLPTHQIKSKSEKLFVDGHMDGWMAEFQSSRSIRSSLSDDL